jgi:hypothetical protein
MSVLTREKPPKVQPVDPIQALAAARELGARLDQEFAAVKRRIAQLPASKMSGAALSLQGGIDTVTRKAEDVAALLAGEELAAYASGPSELFRRRDALEEATQHQGQKIVSLTIEAGAVIFARDWQGKHRAALKRIAAAMVELAAADEAERALAAKAMQAGALPSSGGCSGFAMRPSLRLANQFAFRQFVQSLVNIKSPEQLL